MAAVVVLLVATPVWAAPFTGGGDPGIEAGAVLADETESEPPEDEEPDLASPSAGLKTDADPGPDISEVLAAELEAVCADALDGDGAIAGRTVVRQAAEVLAREHDVSTFAISRAVYETCGAEIAALGRPAATEPEPETETETEPPAQDAAATAGDTWTVVNVVDGDTVDVRSASGTERVRVIGIDTPERGECGFGPASSALQRLILGEEVRLTPGARTDRDRYDRILRYIDIGGTDAGLSLIEQGLAIARYDSRDGYGRHPRQDAYVAADNRTEHTCGVTFESATAGSSGSPGSSGSSDSSGSSGSSGTGSSSGGPGSGPGGAWKNCAEAREAGAAPVHRGDPGYGPHLDGDGDGVGCEASGSSSGSSGSQDRPASSDSGAVKKSTSDICHAPGTTYYDRTKNYTPFETIEECLDSGGRRPKG